MKSYLLILGVLAALMPGILAGCKPKKLKDGRAIAEEVERRTVKRFTEKQILAEAHRLGDSLTRLADSLASVRLPANVAVPKALESLPPTQFPEVQALAQDLGATLQLAAPEAGRVAGGQVNMHSASTFLYTRPFYLRQAPAGVWQVVLKRKAVLEALTLKDMKNPRPRS